MSQGTKIQGSVVNRSLLDDYKTRVMEGYTYRVANFVVALNEWLYRATNHVFKLMFTPRTHVVERSNFFMDFPNKFWNLDDVIRVDKEKNIDYLIG